MKDLVTYHKISKEDAATLNAVRAAASQEYDRKLKPFSDAMDKAWGTPDYDEAEKAYTRAMIKLDGQRDAKINKANRASALVMKEAWYRYVLGEEEPAQMKQLALWEVCSE